MKSIRAGRGLGDAIYLQSIVRHITERGTELDVLTDWPVLFEPLGVKTSEFRRIGADLIAHYTERKAVAETDQFQDCCIRAGITGPVDLRLVWNGRRDFDTTKPVIAVQLPRAPFGRSDGYGMDLLPDFNVLQRAIDLIGDRAYVVQLGSGKRIRTFGGLDLDLANLTSVSELLDAACGADAFLGYCSFMVPLAEAQSKPALFVWSRRGLNSPTPYIKDITPLKIMHRHTSRYVVDDCYEKELAGAVDALCDAARRCSEVRRQDSGGRWKRARVA